MIRENLLYKIMSGIHVVFFTSILCAVMILCTGTILMIPAIAALFPFGKLILEKKFNINDSVVKTYFRNLKKKLNLLRYLPINCLLILNYFGLRNALAMNMNGIAIACIVLMSFLIVLIFFIAGFSEFMDHKGDIIETVMAMFCQPQYMFPIFVLMVILLMYVNLYILIILAFCGSFFIMALEVPVFMQYLKFKMIFHIEDEDTTQFSYLVKRKEHR